MQVTPIWDQICNQMQVVPPGCQICNTKNYSSLMDSIAWVWCAIGQFFIKTIKDFDLCLSQVHIYIENTPSYLVCFRTSLACFIWLSFKKEPKVRRRKSEVWYLTLGSNNVCICASLGTQAYLYVHSSMLTSMSAVDLKYADLYHQCVLYHVKNQTHVSRQFRWQVSCVT